MDHAYINNKKWFDTECRAAREIYQESLKTFNKLKSNENREALCRNKKEYKQLLKRKRKQYETQILLEIEICVLQNQRIFGDILKNIGKVQTTQ